MKIIVWYDNYENGLQKMENIISSYGACLHTVKTKIISNINKTVQIKFSNGDTLKVVPARKSFKGFKCNISIVERSIPFEIFDTIIEPCTMSYPIRGFDFFGEGELRL